MKFLHCLHRAHFTLTLRNFSLYSHKKQLVGGSSYSLLTAFCLGVNTLPLQDPTFVIPLTSPDHKIFLKNTVVKLQLSHTYLHLLHPRDKYQLHLGRIKDTITRYNGLD